MPKKYIGDLITLIQSTINDPNNKDTERFLAFLDFEKAFGSIHEQQGRCWKNFSVSYVAMQEEFCSPWGPIGWSRIAMSDLGRWGHACGSGSAI